MTRGRPHRGSAVLEQAADRVHACDDLAHPLHHLLVEALWQRRSHRGSVRRRWRSILRKQRARWKRHQQHDGRQHGGQRRTRIAPARATRELPPIKATKRSWGKGGELVRRMLSARRSAGPEASTRTFTSRN